MSEYISREDIVNECRRYGNHEHNVQFKDGVSKDRKHDSEVAMFVCEHFRKFVKEFPSADVRENIHGHWERDTEIDGYRCSNCGSTGMDYWNGCPYCLADMREAKGLTVKVGIVGKGKPSLLNQIIPKGEKGEK